MTTSTNFTSISYAEETVPGEIPTGDYQMLPTTGGSPVSNLSTEVSQVIRRDRMTDDLVIVDSEISGDINFELSYAPYMPIVESTLRKTPRIATIDGTGGGTTSVTVTNNGDGTATLLGDQSWLLNSNLAVGGVYKFDNFTNVENNGYFEIVSLANTQAVIKNPDAVDETLDTTTPIEWIIQGRYTNNGAEDMQTFTFLKTVEGIQNTAYFYYAGCAISSLTLNFATGSILTGTFSVMGREETPTETPVHGTIIDVPSYAVMNSVNNVVAIEIEGLTATTCFESLDLTIANNTAAAKCIGVLGAADVADFTCDVTANVSLYFEDLVAYNKFVNAQSFSVKIVLKDSDDNVIIINLPKCKFEALDVPIDGKDSFLMQSGSFRALREPGDYNYIIGITFVPGNGVYV